MGDLRGRRSSSCHVHFALGRTLGRGETPAELVGCVPRARDCPGSAGTPGRGSGPGTAGGTTACPSGDGPCTRWCPRRDVDLPTSSRPEEGGSR